VNRSPLPIIKRFSSVPKVGCWLQVTLSSEHEVECEPRTGGINEESNGPLPDAAGDVLPSDSDAHPHSKASPPHIISK